MRYTKIIFICLLVTFELIPVDKDFLVRSTFYPILILLSGVISYVISSLEERNFYASVYEDLHVVSNHPRTGRAFLFSGDLEEANRYIINVPYNKVQKTARKTRRLLYEAGNPNINPDLEAAQRVDVHTHTFQEGGRVNETWEEFCEYVENQIKENRAKRHEMMYQKSFEWYITNHEKQKV